MLGTDQLYSVKNKIYSTSHKLICLIPLSKYPKIYS